MSLKARSPGQGAEPGFDTMNLLTARRGIQILKAFVASLPQSFVSRYGAGYVRGVACTRPAAGGVAGAERASDRKLQEASGRLSEKRAVCESCLLLSSL